MGTMKRNNALPNNHFKKTAKQIKTWFNQPARKETRRLRRAEKGRTEYPMPTKKLLPIVQCQSIRHNRKERLGRGFTAEECKAAGLDFHYARTIGISVDLRRRNMNQEFFDRNVERLKTYQSKMTIYETLKEAKDAKAVQHKGV